MRRDGSGAKDLGSESETRIWTRSLHPRPAPPANPQCWGRGCRIGIGWRQHPNLCRENSPLRSPAAGPQVLHQGPDSRPRGAGSGKAVYGSGTCSQRGSVRFFGLCVHASWRGCVVSAPFAQPGPTAGSTGVCVAGRGGLTHVGRFGSPRRNCLLPLLDPILPGPVSSPNHPGRAPRLHRFALLQIWRLCASFLGFPVARELREAEAAICVRSAAAPLLSFCAENSPFVSTNS